MKVFEGGGGWNGSLVLLDPDLLTPLTELDGLSISKIPPGLCITPPLTATRTISGAGETSIEGVVIPAWRSGETYEVSIAIADIRAADGGECGAPDSVTITEQVPADWTVSDVTGGGNAAGETITWTLTGDALVGRYADLLGPRGGRAWQRLDRRSDRR